MRDPSAVFADPGEVLAHGRLAAADMRRILEQWRCDLVRLQEASGAGQIRRIDDCLRRLDSGRTEAARA